MRWAGPSARGRRFQLTGAFLTYTAVAFANSAACPLPPQVFPSMPIHSSSSAPSPCSSSAIRRIALYLLFFIALGIRWAWNLLQPHGIKITGPETLPPTTPNPEAQK